MWLTTRSYRAGDEARVVALWNHSYQGYAGLATRTAEYWRWSILRRPDMSEDDILLVESGQLLVGYAALWSGGTVLELAVEPDLPAASRRSITRQLLSQLESRARLRKWDSVELLLPACDRLIDRTLRSAGYAVDDGPTFIIRLLNPRALLLSLTAARQARFAALRGQSLLMTLSPGDDPFLLQHRLAVRFGDSIEVCNLGEKDSMSADAELQLSLAALVELVFSGASARRMLEGGELRIIPDQAAANVLPFLAALAVDAPWYTPRSDTF
jgi:hypothetical protein